MWGLINSILDSSVIFLLPALGEAFSERSGVINIGLEGMMLIGGLVSFIVANSTGSILLGLVAGMIGGICLGLIHSFISIKLKVSQIISGLGIWYFALGFTNMLGSGYIGGSDVVIGNLPGGITPLFPLAIALAPIFWFVLYRTNFGLKIRSAGENPQALAVSGVSVSKMRFIGVLVGSALAALGGAYLALDYNTMWEYNLSAGRGFIAFALVYFARFRPLFVLAGSFLFGGLWVGAIRFAGALGISSYLLGMIPYIATVVAVVLVSLERFRRAYPEPEAVGEPYLEE